MRSRQFLVAFAAHVIVLLFLIPASPWEFDETLFFQGLHRYDPVAHHPPPPGYPVFMMVGKVVRWIIPSDFATLVFISVLGSAIGFALLALAVRNMTGDLTTGISAAVLFYFSPALLVHSTLPISEGGALALFAAALYFWSRTGHGEPEHRAPVLFAIFAALTVGWRIQLSIIIVPFFLLAVAMMKTWRQRLLALAAFTVVCVIWLTPLTLAVGGVNELIRFETAQGEYLAEHDAEVSRSGWTPARVALRFIAHAWGTKLVSIPVLLAAAAGVFSLRQHRALLPFAIAAAGYLAFALLVMDPADGVRYSIPFVLAVAVLAAIGLQFFVSFVVESLSPRESFSTTKDTKDTKRLVLITVFAAASLVYVSSLVAQRGSRVSPPVSAANYARAKFPDNAVAVYELPLWPHATYYLREHDPVRIDRGLSEQFERPDVPMYMFADGATSLPGARVFLWRTSDAYTKLTRNHYRAASIIPITPDRRFRVIRGVHSSEREPGGREWRWLSSPAELQLPRGGARTLTVRLGLPAIYPFADNDVVVKVNGAENARVHLERGKRVNVIVSVPAGAPVIRFEPRVSYVPAELPDTLNLDPRRLAVEMYDLRTSAPAPAARQAGSR